MDNTTKKILDVGCGKRKKTNATGIDINPRSDADIVHDLNQYPYPFVDDAFHEVYADNILEHLDDIVKVMTELHRITRSDGFVEITVPFYPHRNANTDPTHKHFFGVHSFDYFISGTDYADFEYSSVKFQRVFLEFDKGVVKRHFFDTLLAKFANNNKDFYENRLANILPLRQLTFRLIPVK